ncbi:hypothetical protein Cantr_06509 [Candida viswanathii]|uniref:Uncharacterized protein n=1 Tax=Candida viswanathii TaxID=5486 RepID=A0A367XW24_9ASCO|nr:hypothetical protein Cantr_06509 [Candida viswanathii]
MTKEPYYSSHLTTIKPANPKNFSIFSPDLPVIISNPNLKNAPPLNPATKSIRRDSVEPYFNKPVKIGVMPPAILSQFTYYFHDESAIVEDEDDDELDFEQVGYSSCVVAPQNVLAKVSDNYEELAAQEESAVKLMEHVNVPVAISSTHASVFEINKDDLLDKTNNPNVLINNRSRKLSDKLLAPDLSLLKFVNDSFEYSESYDAKKTVRDDYINEPCTFIV